MTKRRLDTHEECLKAFSSKPRKEIKENLKAWSSMDRKQAQARRLTYANVVFLLKGISREFYIPLVDLGLADYEVPTIDEGRLA